MTQELVWIYGCNLIVNSLLAFTTTVLLVYLLIFGFRIKQPRIKAILLSLPIIKLTIDPLLYDFDSWALMHHMNPLDAEVGSRMLSAMICFPTSMADIFPVTTSIGLYLNDGRTFTPGDIAALTLSTSILKGIILATAVISLSLLGIFLMQLIISARHLSRLIQSASSCTHAVQNPQLKHKLEQTNSKLIVSSEIDLPCAFGILRKWICFPPNLIEQLSLDELEAVVAHEINHLRWFDSIVRALSQCISAVFWWIPTAWLINQIEWSQETACDHYVSRLNISKLALASAMVKTVKANRCSTTTVLLSTRLVNTNVFSKRIQTLLEEPAKLSKPIKWLQISLVGFITLSFFLGRFWIF